MKTKNIYVPLETAKAVIIDGLEAFDPYLAEQAKRVLYNNDRLNITEIAAPREKMMMRCRPAGLTEEELGDFRVANVEEDYGSEFAMQWNDDGSDAIIDMHYAGRRQDVVILAHECGHAMADDVYRGCGLTFRDFSWDETEHQAYFIQSIVENHITKNPELQSLLGSSVQQEMSERSLGQLTTARQIFNETSAMTLPERSARSFEALGGLPHANTCTLMA